MLLQVPDNTLKNLAASYEECSAARQNPRGMRSVVAVQSGYRPFDRLRAISTRFLLQPEALSYSTLLGILSSSKDKKRATPLTTLMII
jgi:hypothetical protein